MNKIVLVGALLITVLILLFVLSTNNATERIEVRENVTTSFYPLYYFASRIAGDAVPVYNLAGTQDAHDYTPTRADMERLLSSQLVILQGAGLETWTEDIEARLTEANISFLVVAEHLALREQQAETHTEHDNSTETHENEEPETGETEAQHTKEVEDAHGHGVYDPHTWLDPILAQEMVRHISEALVATYPEHREVFLANTKQLLGELATLHEAYLVGLGTCEVREAIVSHEATGYLASRYALTFHAIAGISTNDEPSAKLLAELKNEAQEGIHGILLEENAVAKFADTLARETGLATYPWNPLGRGPLSDDKDYFTVMYDNLNSLKSALHCTQ